MQQKPFFQSSNLSILHDDILATQQIEKKSIDLIVTSPPYNLEIAYNQHDDRKTYKEYLAFTKTWLTRCFQLIRPDGRLCLNIPLDKNKGGQQSICADL